MSASNGRWRPVTPAEPCPACGHGDKCAWSPDRAMLCCWRCDAAPAGMRYVKPGKAGGFLFAANGNGRAHGGAAGPLTRGTPRRAPAAKAVDLSALTERFKATLTDEQRDGLARDLGVTPASLAAVGCGWATRDDLRALGASGDAWDRDDFPAGAFSFPERDGNGRIVGIHFRLPDGRKGAASKAKAGASRGLIAPATLKDRPDPVLIVEGASDVAACETLGLAAVGRPSNTGGADDVAKLLEGRAVLIVGENDQKEGGDWPGRNGARNVARRIAGAWKEPVSWTLPPDGVKDARAWLQSRVAGGLNLADADACRKAGADLLAALMADTTEAKPEKVSQSEALVRIALELYRIGRTESDEPFAVARAGPNVALMFRGSRDALRASLAKEFRRRCGKTPTASALADAMTALQGEALDAEAEPVALRVAEHDDGIVIDLGDATGRAIIVRPGAWEVMDVSPILFRRTALTAALPEPQRGGNLGLLRDLLNVADDSWPLMIGWLIAAYLPGIPHPILMLGGQQGTGKSTAARLLAAMFDPSPAPLRSEPRDPEQWAMAAAGSWGVCIDNVSGISGWWSDALCKAVTGDGWIRRRLYTDSDLAVLAYRRVVMLTSIDAGALRGDLGDRLLLVDLLPIDETRRRTEAELDRLFNERRPLILGALLDLLAGALAKLPGVELQAMPRMADFARVLAAVDALPRDDRDAGDGQSLALYLAQAGRIAGDVVDGDPVAAAIIRLIDGLGDVARWEGTAGDLLTRLTPAGSLPPGWPKAANKLTGRLKRLTPALMAVGVGVTIHPRTSTGRIVTIERVPKESSLSSPSSPDREYKAGASDDPSDDTPPPADLSSPGSSRESIGKTRPGDGSDDSDDQFHLPSTGDGWVAEGEL